MIKKIISLLFVAGILMSVSSCGKIIPQDDTVSVYLTYTITTDSSEIMPGTKSTNAQVFDDFYQKIRSGELVAPNYKLTLTEKNTGVVYVIDGNWKSRDMVTLRTGTYSVTGTSTAEGENIQDKCSLKFDDEITVDIKSTTVNLKAAYDCSLVIFSDVSIARLSNFNGNAGTELFKLNDYFYAFIHTKLYVDEKKDQAYLEGSHTNGTQFRIYTGNLNYETGKYYIYNDINVAFDLDKMEEGEAETGEDDAVVTDLSKNGTANCYIINKAGTYKFKATVKGNSTESVGIPAKAEVLWETSCTEKAPGVGDIIASASFSEGYVTVTTPSALADGNAVVAVKNASGTILWSWHLWVCEGYDPVASEQSYANNAGTMMDRNLGALSVTAGKLQSMGLCYQWGRKDPSLTCTKETEVIKSTIIWPADVKSNSTYGTIEYAVQHRQQQCNLLFHCDPLPAFSIPCFAAAVHSLE